MTYTPDTLWIVRFPNGGAVTSVVEHRVREEYESVPGSKLYRRPFPSTVKLPWIGDDYAFDIKDGVDSCTHTPTGVVGWGSDRREAYKQMLRALHDHLERQTEILVSE